MLLTASCVRIERVQDGASAEILVRPVNDVHTKADYPQDGTFGLFAYYADCPGGTAWDSDKAWYVAVPYFSDAAFSNNGTSWGGYDLSGAQAKPYYWPFSGSLMFAGYSPHKDVSDGTISDVSLVRNIIARGDVNPYLQIKFTQNVDPARMVDLMWFDVKDVASGESLSKTSDAVNVLFKHALSKVSLTFVDSHGIYRLSSVLMKNCINSSEFYSGKTAGWMPLADAEGHCDLEDYSLPVTKVGEDWPSMSDWNSNDAVPLLIIPQYMDGVYPTFSSGTLDTGGDVILEFTVTDGFGEQTVEVMMKDHTDRWELGKHYLYTVTVNADPIDFGAPSVTITTQTVSM